MMTMTMMTTQDTQETITSYQLADNLQRTHTEIKKFIMKSLKAANVDVSQYEDTFMAGNGKPCICFVLPLELAVGVDEYFTKLNAKKGLNPKAQPEETPYDVFVKEHSKRNKPFVFNVDGECKVMYRPVNKSCYFKEGILTTISKRGEHYDKRLRSTGIVLNPYELFKDTPSIFNK